MDTRPYAKVTANCECGVEMPQPLTRSIAEKGQGIIELSTFDCPACGVPGNLEVRGACLGGTVLRGDAAAQNKPIYRPTVDEPDELECTDCGARFSDDEMGSNALFSHCCQ